MEELSVFSVLTTSNIFSFSPSSSPRSSSFFLGSRISSNLSSASSRAFTFTFSCSSFLAILTASSVRSLTMASTSRPTYPTSVNLVASTLRNGDLARRARRLAISVFPTPVGPIMMMFFGAISSLSSGGTCCRRHLFLRAMATERFAWSCPMMYLSNSETISLGVKTFMS